MASEIRVNSIKNRSGLGTITVSDSGAVFSGVTTFAQIQTTSGEITVGTGASVFSPATNVLALGTNNTEKVRITSGGSVGIGTDAPGQKLDVNGVIRAVDGTAPEIIVSDNFVNKRFIFGYTQSPVGHNLGSKILADGLNIGYYTRLDQNGSHIFYTNNGGSDAERLRITSTGRVGIGTDNPTRNVHISGTTTNILRLENTNANVAGIELTGSTGQSSIFHNSDDLRFLPGGTEQFRITSSGNVGINTTTIETKLDVFEPTGTNSSRALVRFQKDHTQTSVTGNTGARDQYPHALILENQDNSADTGTVSLSFSKFSSGVQSQAIIAGIQESAGNMALTLNTESGNSMGERLRISSDGNIGIGTDYAPTKLTVAGDIIIRPTDGNVNSGNLALKFGLSNNPDNNQQKTSIIAKPNGSWGRHDLHFCLDTGGDLGNADISDSKVVFMNDGKVGIGTTQPSAKFEVGSGDLLVDGSIRTKNYVQNGTTSEGTHLLKETIANSSFEANPFSHPFLMNDLANHIARGGSYAISGLTSVNSGIANLFSTQSFWTASNSQFSGSTFTITLTNLQHGLNYGSYAGIVFGSTSFAPASLKIETSTDNGSNWTTRLDHTGRQSTYFTAFSSGGTVTNAIRYTIGQGAAGSVRIQSLWAFNYASTGMHHYFLPRDGGQLYGNLSFPSGNGIDFSAASGSASGSTSAVLDDYEEGTFTPRISVEGQSGDAAIDNVSGTYVRVGQLVHCTFNADLNGIPAGRGTSFAWQWGGLPFTSLAEGSDGSEDYIGSARVAAADHTSTYGVASEFILRLFDNGTGGRIEAMRVSNGDIVNASLWMKDNTAITGSITYRTS